MTITAQTLEGKDWHQIRKEQKLMAIPADLTGKLVLDIGGYDGAMSLEAVNRGAVEAIVVDSQQYQVYEDYNNPRVEHERVAFWDMDVMSKGGSILSSHVIFAFDVMYHMKNPYAFAERLYTITEEVLCLSTRITSGGSDYWRRYKPREQHHNDPTVAWKPTYGSLSKLMEIVGFRGGVNVYTEHPGMFEEDGFIVQRWFK